MGKEKLRTGLFVLFYLLGVTFNIVALCTNHWMSVRKLAVTDPQLPMLTYQTDAYYGLFRICINYDAAFAVFNDGCHALNARCQADAGFGQITIFGLKKLGHCSGYNATRVLALVGLVVNIMGLLFMAWWFCKPQKWVGYTSAVAAFVASAMGLIAMCIFVSLMYYQDGSYKIWGLEYQYSFWLFVCAWVFNLFAGWLGMYSARDPRFTGVQDKLPAAVRPGGGGGITDDKVKLSSAADGARLHADMDCVDVDDRNDDPYGHRYPEAEAGNGQNSQSFHTHVF